VCSYWEIRGAATGQDEARPLAAARDAKKLDMRVIIRITAVILVVFSLGWAGCQSTHSDGSSGTTTPASATTEPSAEQDSTVPASADQSPNTVSQTVQHTQPGMQNMPAASPTPRPPHQTGKTLALTGPARVPARATNQAAPVSPLVVTQAPAARAVIGPISFQGPPRHKGYAVTNQQKFLTGRMGALVLAGIGLLVIIRKIPLWREKLRGMVQSKGGKKSDGPRLVLDGAPQRASPLDEE
jgi:hypothetical protein